jgi:hypothetical protein
VPANGSFETGDLTSWTAGGYTRAGAIRSSHVTPTTSLTIPDGTWAGAVSTGPGERASGSTGATNFDNLGGNNDYDQSWLQSSFTGKPIPSLFNEFCSAKLICRLYRILAFVP